MLVFLAQMATCNLHSTDGHVVRKDPARYLPAWLSVKMSLTRYGDPYLQANQIITEDRFSNFGDLKVPVLCVIEWNA
jgi:hypothetical protein